MRHSDRDVAEPCPNRTFLQRPKGAGPATRRARCSHRTDVPPPAPDALGQGPSIADVQREARLAKSLEAAASLQSSVGSRSTSTASGRPARAGKGHRPYADAVDDEEEEDAPG